MRNDLAGVHVLNKFIWFKLKEAVLIDPQKYNGLIPIVPTQEIPAMADLPTNTPYIVYTYTNAGYDEDFWADREQIVYRIYSDNERQLRQISNFLIDLLKRYDWTAEEVNDFIHTFSSTDGDEKKFDFKYSDVINSIGPEPFDQEGGRQACAVTIQICYTHEIQGIPGVAGQGMRA
jgi:hypothetical protein